MYSNFKRTLPKIEGNILNGKGSVNLSQHSFITISKLLDILSEEFEHVFIYIVINFYLSQKYYLSLHFLPTTISQII